MATKVTLGSLTDDMFDLREQKRALLEKIKSIEEQYKEKEQKLIEILDDQGTDRGAGKHANCTVAESVVPQVENWDEFYKYIQKNKYWHLLERRPSVTGCRELFETKGAIPGVSKFTKRGINLRSK